MLIERPGREVKLSAILVHLRAFLGTNRLDTAVL